MDHFCNAKLCVLLRPTMRTEQPFDGVQRSVDANPNVSTRYRA